MAVTAGAAAALLGRQLVRLRQGAALNGPKVIFLFAVLPVQAISAQTRAHQLEAAVLTSLEQALTPRTRMVVLSHLLWNTGAVMPIAQVAERLQGHGRQPWLLGDRIETLQLSQAFRKT